MTARLDRDELVALGLDGDAPGADRARRPRLAAAHVRSASRRSSCKGRVADWVAEIRRLRDAGETIAVRRGDAGPRRAHHRAAQGVRRLRRAGRARRRCAVRGGAGRGRRAVARLPAARRRPADLRRGGRLRGGAPRTRAPALGHQGVSLRPARSQGRRPRRPRRPRHRHVRRPEADRRSATACRSSSSCATPARTSCSSRSSGSTWSRNTPARRGRRSIGSAARRGSAPRPRSRRPCATWPRSCSSSTPRARRCPATPSAADSHWQQEFEDAFEYDLTPDQTTAIADIKRDMESPTPMDRLLCGDVGYGKTEVAMRAAFKAVMDGKQVAFLAPTTVLAFQHQKTLQRAVRRLSRCASTWSAASASKAEQKEIARPISPPARSTSSSARTGCCRRTSQFRDLGLLVVDEEQRFGVAHKERIKQMRKKVDVLTMTATPIPRTLNMSLVGIRDMSIIETPPKDRLSIQTNVVKFDPAGDRPRDPQRARARRPGLLRPQPRRVDLLDRRPDPAAGARGARRRRPRPDGRGRARARDARLRRAQVRRAAGDDDRRERPRHPERQHDHHQPRRSLRPVAALSAARPRRPIRSPGVRVSADSAGRQPVAGREEAAGGDQGVQRSRQRLPRRRARPRDSRRRQPARRRAERPHRDASASRCT